MNELEKMKQELDILDKQLEETINKFDFLNCKSFDEYKDYIKPYTSKMNELSRNIRMLKEYKLEDIPSYGDVMKLDDFVECVQDGVFIDYDGSGNYIKDGKMTNISIYPSDIKYGAIRKEFVTIIWFNR